MNKETIEIREQGIGIMVSSSSSSKKRWTAKSQRNSSGQSDVSSVKPALCKQIS
jgi:hypothetical protein